MLGVLNNTYLYQRNIRNEGLYFFIQRWTELTDSRTIYSYQYTYHNLLSSLNECIEVINKTLDGSYTTRDNLKSLLEEIVRFVEKDVLLQKYKPQVTKELTRILGTGLKENHKIKYLLAHIEYYANMIREEYSMWLRSTLLEAVINKDFDAIEACSQILISYCIDKGWSLKGLYEIHKTLFKQQYENDIKKLYSFISYLYTSSGEYHIFIQIPDQKTYMELYSLSATFGLSVHSGEEINNQYNEVAGLIHVQDKRYYCIEKIVATDPYAAALQAIERQKKSIELLFFYDKIGSGQAIQKKYYVLNNSSKFVTAAKLEDIFRTHMKVNDSNSIYDYTIGLFNNGNEKMAKVQSQLQNVYTYVNISKNSVYQEEKFLNLWIALEAFMNTGQYGNNIAHIKNVLPSIMAKRYFYRLYRNLYEDLRRANVNLHLIDDKFSVDHNEELSKHEIVERICEILKDWDLYEKLCRQLKGYTLLGYRVEKMRKFVTNDNRANDKIKNYIKTISWHVQRMYRIRNDITHDSFVANKDFTPFIEHLHDFLVTTIAEVVLMASVENVHDINQIYASVSSNLEIFMDRNTHTSVGCDGIIGCI